MASTTYEHFSGYGETVTKRHHFAVCVSWKVATTAIPIIRRRRTATSTSTLSPATLT